MTAKQKKHETRNREDHTTPSTALRVHGTAKWIQQNVGEHVDKGGKLIYLGLFTQKGKKEKRQNKYYQHLLLRTSTAYDANPKQNK
jgi:hypothetical protein